MPDPEAEYEAHKTAESLDPEGNGRTRLQDFFHRCLSQLRSGISGSQLRRNMGAGSIMGVAGMCLSIFSYPLYLHYLGYHRYGIWLVLSVVVSVAQLGNLGIPWALTKLVAEDHGIQIGRAS